MSNTDKKWNEVIDVSTHPLSHTELEAYFPQKIVDCDITEFSDYVLTGQVPFPVMPAHKKALEFFFSFKILNPQPEHHVMDLAGGRSVYLTALRRIRGCTHLYLSDHIFEGVMTNSDKITVVGGDAGEIQIPDESLDRIACHHAFEHFQGESDSNAIREIGRLLRPGGVACLIPLFATQHFIECWNIPKSSTFDPAATLIFDPSASIPGADEDGHFARFYNIEALDRRVIRIAAEIGLKASIVACRLNGQDLPDMKTNFGSVLNYPLRALVLEKPSARTL